MIDVRAMLLLGVKGFFVALGFCLCVVAAFCLLSLVAGISNGIAKRIMPVMLALYPLTAFGNWLAVAFYKLRRW